MATAVPDAATAGQDLLPSNKLSNGAPPLFEPDTEKREAYLAAESAVVASCATAPKARICSGE